MGNEKSTANGGSDGVEEAPVQPRDVPSSEQINLKIVENVLIIWLDPSIDERKVDCQNTVTQFRRFVNNVCKYTNGEECVRFLETIDKEKACMIISGTLGQQFVPRVHEMSQIDSIFIFGNTKQYQKEWLKQWPKVKGIFTEIRAISEALKKAVQQCEQDSMPISIIDTTEDATQKKLNQLDSTFMYTQVFKEILLTIDFDDTHVTEFVKFCQETLAGNQEELKNLKKFEEDYYDDASIWWYTYDCFLHRMLNHAFSQMDIDLIIKLGFFTNDLHRRIKHLFREQYDNHPPGTSFTLYRGQGMLKTEFDKLSKSKDGLIAFNNFFIASKKRNNALSFAQGALTNSKMIGVLFVMKIDPTESLTPFASISNVSSSKDKEDEILFSMQTVFCIGAITSMGENNRLFQVELTLTSDNDQDLRKLIYHIRTETYPDHEKWFRLGQVLLEMGQFQKAQQLYEILLKQTMAESKKGHIYHLLGMVKNNQGEYKEAIEFYEKAVDIYKTRSTTDINLASCYNNLGNVYSKIGDYPNARSSYERALEIKQQSLPPSHPDLATSNNYLGNTYSKLGDYPNALLRYEKALEIKQRSLPADHLELGMAYNNVGLAYAKMGDYPKALSSHEKALEIKQKSLPPDHPQLGMSYNNIGNEYFSMGDYPKALINYEKALAIQEQSLPPNHSDLANSCSNIGLVYVSMRDYAKARPYYERAVNIGEQSLPPNHPRLDKWRKNFESIKKVK